MTMDRPAWKIDSNNPGTDLACETAAALASASILFKDVDSAYSEELLTHARQEDLIPKETSTEFRV